MIQYVPGKLAAAALVLAMAGTVNMSFASDIRQSTLKRAPAIQKQLQLGRTCAPGFSLLRRSRKAYDCEFLITPACRKKYEVLRKFPPYIIKTKNPPWMVYICSKNKPGNSKSTSHDCISGFSKTGEVPNSHYRCYRPFKPQCRAGYRPARLTRGFRAQGAMITQVSYRYTCMRP